jgi:hypothetical protein
MKAMPPDPQSQSAIEPDRLEAATDQAIAACGGNARDAVKALIVANEFLETEVCELMQAVSHAYARGRFHTYSGWAALVSNERNLARFVGRQTNGPSAGKLHWGRLALRNPQLGCRLRLVRSLAAIDYRPVVISVAIAVFLDDDSVPIPMFVAIADDCAVAISIAVTVMPSTDCYAGRSDTDSNLFRTRRQRNTNARNSGNYQSKFHHVLLTLWN